MIMIIRRIVLAVCAAGLALSGLTAAPAVAKPVGPVTPTAFVGCVRHWIEGGNRAYVEGCQGRGMHEFRAYAYCNSGARAVGTWVTARNGSWSLTSVCFTGVQKDSKGRYIYGYDDR
jgi:hypothetical protein